MKGGRDQTAAFLKAEVARWVEIVKATGVRIY